MKPIVKWAGGKTNLLEDIKNNMPKKFDRYVEPFVGGGAVFLNLGLKNTWINDFNKELMNLYKKVKSSPQKLMKNIEELRTEYDEDPEPFFYWLRDLDENRILFNNLNNGFKAARTLFLNKTGFNGLFRVNTRGHFNVPWNKSNKAPAVYEKDNILEISEYLKTIKMTSGKYQKMLKNITGNDFVYLDPPYDKLKKDSFTSYNADEFGEEQQKELKKFCDSLNAKGTKFMESNHNTELIRKLYKDYKIVEVQARRAINSNGEGRGKITEVLIMNY